MSELLYHRERMGLRVEVIVEEVVLNLNPGQLYQVDAPACSKVEHTQLGRTFKAVYSVGDPLFFIEEFPHCSHSAKGLLYVEDIRLQGAGVASLVTGRLGPGAEGASVLLEHCRSRCSLSWEGAVGLQVGCAHQWQKGDVTTFSEPCQLGLLLLDAALKLLSLDLFLQVTQLLTEVVQCRGLT